MVDGEAWPRDVHSDVYIYELAMGLWHWRGAWSETEGLVEQFPGSRFQSGCGCNFTAATPELAEFYLAVVPRADQRLPGVQVALLGAATARQGRQYRLSPPEDGYGVSSHGS